MFIFQRESLGQPLGFISDDRNRTTEMEVICQSFLNSILVFSRPSDAEHHCSPLLGGKCWLVLGQHSKHIVGWQPWYIRPLMLKAIKFSSFSPQSKGAALTLHMMDFRWAFQNCIIIMQRCRGVGQIVNTGPQQIGVFLYPCVV